MNTIRWYQASMLLLFALVSGQGLTQQEPSHSDSLDTIKIEKLTGVKGKLDAAEKVFRLCRKVFRNQRQFAVFSN